jgi:hypothetical protein
MKKKLVTVIAVSAAAVALGLGAGSAAALVPGLFSPAGLSAGPGVPTTPMPVPTYSVNPNGLTFGSAADSDKPSDEPDLIQASATNGKTGYILKSDLDAVDGTDAAKNFKSPEDAVAWQESSAAQDDHSIPVYEADGKTQIGVFVVQGAKTQASVIPDPSQSK